jgi:hypothetical protein
MTANVESDLYHAKAVPQKEEWTSQSAGNIVVA